MFTQTAEIQKTKPRKTVEIHLPMGEYIPVTGVPRLDYS